MKKQVYYNSLDEKEKIMGENSNLYIIEIYETLNENYLVLSSSPAVEDYIIEHSGVVEPTL